MPFASPAEFLEFAKSSGVLPTETVDSLAADNTLPTEIEPFLTALRERGLLAEDPPIEPVPLSTDEEFFVPPAAIALEEPFAPPLVMTPAGLASRIRTTQTMSRETMWTWLAAGGAMWLLGLVVLGLWMGGCFRDDPKPKTGQSSR